MYPGLCLLFLVHLLLKITATKNLPPYTPTDLILLDCGAPSNSISLDGRKWNTDTRSKFDVSNSRNSSSAFTASENDRSVPGVPYMTARIFHSTFTYTFPLSPGPKFVRLYFNAAAYSNLDIPKSFFSLQANQYILLTNFSAFLTASAIQPQVDYLKKEFIITIREKQMLNMTFDPSPTSFAFINGIEIVSMPNGLYEHGMDTPVTFAGSDTLFVLDDTTALEALYRLNVGGAYVGGINDTGMFRTWLEDSDFTIADGFVHMYGSNESLIKYTKKTPPFVAPALVYATTRSLDADDTPNINLAWIFPVDSGFNYLVRLHFCELREKVIKTNDVVFSIFINNQTAEQQADIIYLSGGNSLPLYKDYIVWMPKHRLGKRDLWLTLYPYIDGTSRYADAFLNGLEVLKLNNSDGSLAAFNLEPIVAPPEHQARLRERKKSKAFLLIVAIIGAAVGSVLGISVIAFFFIYRRKQKAKDAAATVAKRSFWLPFLRKSGSTIAGTALLLPTDLCHQFTMAEIRAATTNFDVKNAIGIGGFGTVYKGLVRNESTPVAIKRLSSSSKQGIREFHTEIKMLSRLRHAHLVPLIGYCDEESEMILVYEFMPHGNLQDHLYKAQKTPLPWKQRLQICIGAAQGLHYLHTGAMHTIIHRDVKSSNILLDANWVGKVSDFGLSKAGPTSESQTHISSVVKGTLGYLDPEYLRRFQLTEKSDVYSFGVVLLEVVCGRPPIMPTQSKEQVNLVDWARNCLRRGIVDQIIDSHLKGDITRVSLNKFMEIAESCVRERASERPTIGDVVFSLELALEFQQTAEKNGNDEFDLRLEKAHMRLLADDEPM